MNAKLLSLLLALGLTAAASAQTPKAPGKAAAKKAAPASQFPAILAKMDLKDGDTVVFLGDSITHQCLYTQYVEDYFYTRHPGMRIHFHNAGVGGDRAANALARFDEDVARFKPKYVTILLGMNDGAYRDFDKATFDTYTKDMTTLLDRIAAIGAKAIVMTPTMHDARAARAGKRGPQEPRDTYYNGVLALYGAWLREQAHVRGLGFVDMYSPLNNYITDARKKNPDYTLIKDAVHPDAPGQVVMGVALINDTGVRSAVSSLTVQEVKGKLGATAANGKVTDFQADGDTIRFTFQANALPWVLPPEADEGYKLTAAGHRSSGEVFAARGLKPGKYELKIDGQSVGTWTESVLGFKVELQANDKTPQHQQALAIALLNKERNDKAMHPLRDLWRDLKVKQGALAKAAPDGKGEAAKAAFEKWKEETFKPGVEKNLALVQDYEQKIYAANKIPARKYELRRVP
ncbi:MAG: SGNH/GDSL hydrolase family protein [Verrucomicrobia bacterium]|nr:SGNH/GDSL hydrolase family protein [Verrucomicrobiota bacterium]